MEGYKDQQYKRSHEMGKKCQYNNLFIHHILNRSTFSKSTMKEHDAQR